jgi:predicted Fe-Mo cluster-binding NifX family protein
MVSKSILPPASSILENMGMLIYRAMGNTINETVVRGSENCCSPENMAPPF